jgi:hypothetical protein
MDDLFVLNRDDREEPIVIGCATRKNLAAHVVLKDHNAKYLFYLLVREVNFQAVTLVRFIGLTNRRPFREV